MRRQPWRTVALTPRLRSGLAGAVLALVATAACNQKAAEEVVSETVVPVTTAPVVAGAIRGRVHATGLVSPAPGGELVVIAPEAARIVDIPRAEGDRVRKGDVLVRFEIPSSAAEAQKQAAEVARAQAAPIEVTAKLLEIPSKMPPDDLYDYAYVMRYEVTDGPMKGQSIFVAHYKPRQARSAIKDQMKKVVSGKVRTFHQGDVHKLQLTPDLKSVWKGALVDEFAATDRKSVRYFALVADPA